MQTAIDSVGPARRNRLLAALPDADWDSLKAQLAPVRMPLGSVLYESGATLSHVYFPTTAIISLLYVLSDGSSVEMAIAGRDGLVGVALFMGGETTPSRAVVQSEGWAYRLSGVALKAEFARGGELQRLMLRYAQALITQMTQTSVCNRHHSIDQQLCRWLLLALDCLDSPTVVMTQTMIANMLGVRRDGVTNAAAKLQAAGLIKYSRGLITVVDRPGLERRCCECYDVLRTECDRLLRGPIRAPVPDSESAHFVA
jgi:CRP-like cAMP-binding protein